MPSVRSKVLADIPFFAVVRSHAASNQIVKAVRVLSKIVPAPTRTWSRQAGHTSRPRLVRHGSPLVPHDGQMKP